MLERQRSEARSLRALGIVCIVASVGFAGFSFFGTHGRTTFLWFGLTFVGVRLIIKASRLS
ncbi:MAG: hypothetical protein JWN44_611 [Myxococcales bacterium]|nr:hypothetical protein [Myxococcales bacterium]